MSAWFHGVKAIYAGLASLAALTATVVGILVAVGVIGGGGGSSANQPPLVGGITLEPPVPVAGQTVRAQVSVTDPDRDQLVIQWSSDVGRFVGGDTGISVTFEPPANKGSFQLTAVISDRHNEPEQVSSSYVIDNPVPAPDQPVLVVTPGPETQPPALELTQRDRAPTETPRPTATPDLGQLDISGRWDYETGYVVFSRISADLFEYSDFESGVATGAGQAQRIEGGFSVNGIDTVINPFTGLPTYMAYAGPMEVISQSRMQAMLYDQFGNFLTAPTFTR